MLSIIIVNYLQKKLLERCVASIYDLIPNGEFEIIIVNNSPEESLTEISQAYPNTIILPSENTGFSKANNLGVKHSKGEHLLFLNADTELTIDFTAQLYKELSGLNYGAVGLGMQFPDGRFQNSFGLFPAILNEYRNKKVEQGFFNKDSLITEERRKYYSATKQVDWVSGAAMFIDKKVFDNIGGFDERFFMYYEDIDICYRLYNAGYKNYYFPYSNIIHHKGENTRGELNNKLKQIQKDSQKLYYRLHNNLLSRILLRIYLFIR